MSHPAFGVRARAVGGTLPPGARLLDPARPGPNTAPTAYNQEGLIVSAVDAGSARLVADALRETLHARDCDFDGPAWLAVGVAASTDLAMPLSDAYISGVRIRPRDGVAGWPDPWSVLNELRAHRDPLVSRSVSLNHILTSAEQPGGNPFAIGHGRVGLDSYGVPGSGGRGPVTFVGAQPRRKKGVRSPRVVVLDSSVGEHPWFAADPVRSEFVMSDGRVVGPEIHPYPRTDGVAADPGPIAHPLVGTLGTHVGHATFICGLIRQVCPEADIIDLPLMGTDGVVPEHMLIRALDLVLAKQLDDPGWADAIVMSLGYYNESPADVDYSSGLKQLLIKLGTAGVAVFAAAGNDATTRPSYPAAFAVDPEFAASDVLPVVSVAALNPDGSLAEFSNDGPWVIAEAIGVNLVSTAPVTLDGSARAAGSGRTGRERSAVDIDNFRGGFESWSGTSFATPVLAGEYLRRLMNAGFPERTSDRRGLLPVGRIRALPG